MLGIYYPLLKHKFWPKYAFKDYLLLNEEQITQSLVSTVNKYASSTSTSMQEWNTSQIRTIHSMNGMLSDFIHKESFTPKKDVLPGGMAWKWQFWPQLTSCFNLAEPDGLFYFLAGLAEKMQKPGGPTGKIKKPVGITGLANCNRFTQSITLLTY